MKFAYLFDAWYVKRSYRRGNELNDRGEIVLNFKGLEEGAIVCVDGHQCQKDGDNYAIRVEEGERSITIMLPSGHYVPVERVIVKNGIVSPAGFNRDDMILKLAERVQELEAAEAEDRREIQHYNDRKSGKLFLGGTKR